MGSALVSGSPVTDELLSAEALPLYWLSQALHSILAADPSIGDIARTMDGSMPDADKHKAAASLDRFSGIDLAKMLQSARVFVSFPAILFATPARQLTSASGKTRLGEGVTSSEAI